ncbi:MAG: aldehyde ferredoxin oxidoreductase [Deltaproteobacteria bacterium]|nr:aldehyde ferredoxin oxidoreductase [Deltaproteobacteria bacterium]
MIGPVDFGMAMQREGDFLCIGSGVLAGSVIPGSNRLVFSGPSPVWDGFFVSTMGGAALIWDGTGISFLAIGGRAAKPSVLVMAGRDGQYPVVRLVPVDVEALWRDDGGPGGLYSLQRHVFERLWDGRGTPRVLATGPAALHTAMGAIGSSKSSQGKLTAVDCWAGRGGMGSRMLQRHNVCAIVYGGDYEDEDLTDRAEADGYFEERFSKNMKLVDLEATTKYRYDPKWSSGGTFGVNYSSLSDMMLSFNYRSVAWPRHERLELWKRLVKSHYLEQFNEETIVPKEQAQCGEPCPAVCKKLKDEFKKDYEPYQTMGPLCGIFDQRPAERLNHRADALGFDAIQIGGQLAWLMECLHEGLVDAATLGLPERAARPRFAPEGFDPVRDSAHNGELALSLLELCAAPENLLARGMRAAARALGPAARDRAVYLSNGPDGWMVPNQYWAPGMFGPQSIMGKYYVHYGMEFLPPRELGKKSAERMVAELTTDNAGMCRFHRGWSEKLWADIVQSHFRSIIDYPGHHARLARELHRRGAPEYWESARIEEIVHGYVREMFDESPGDPVLADWARRFDSDRSAAARAYWDEMRAGIAEKMAELGG